MTLNEIKPRIIKPMDPTPVLQRLKDRVTSMCRKKGISMGNIEIWKEGQTFFIDVEMNSGSAAFIEEVVSTMPHIEVLSAEYHPGKFDWASDTYIKDSATIAFTISR